MADWPFVAWRGTLMTREAFAVIRALSPEDRAEMLAAFQTIEIGEVRRIDEDYPELDA